MVIALPLVPLLGTLAVLFQIRRLEASHEARVAQTIHMQRATDDVLAGALDAETGMRGYLLSERKIFLEPYLRAITQLPKAVEHLRSLGQADDSLRISRVEELVEAQLGLLARLRSSEETGAGEREGVAEERQDAMLLARGKELMDELRAVLREQADNESAELDRASDEEASSHALLDRASYAGVAVGAIGGLTSLLLLLRGIVGGVRRAAEDARGLSEHRPPAPSPERGDELGALTRSLQDAYGELAEQEERRAAAEGALRDANLALEERVRERTRFLEEARLENLQRLALAAEYRDDDTHEHTQRVAETTALLARTLGLPSDEVETLKLAAPLHDVGKIGIPDAILLKPGRLTTDEFQTMKTHTEIGARILSVSRSPILRMGEVIAATHHERWDGSGYPNGLRGEEIPLAGRILAVADVLDALTHERPYKRAWTLDEAIAEIVRQRGHHFDPAVVDALLQFIRPGKTESEAGPK